MNKNILYILALFLICKNLMAENWKEIIKNETVSVNVDQDLFELKGNKDFFIRVVLKNRSSRDLGIDFTGKLQLIYPNQWGESDKPYRNSIDERIAIPSQLEEVRKEQIIDKYKNGKLKLVRPSESIEYYTNFNASGRNAIELGDKMFVLISIKGELIITDGLAVWQEKEFLDNNSDLVIKRPVKWHAIKENSFILMK